MRRLPNVSVTPLGPVNVLKELGWCYNLGGKVAGLRSTPTLFHGRCYCIQRGMGIGDPFRTLRHERHITVPRGSRASVGLPGRNAGVLCVIFQSFLQVAYEITPRYRGFGNKVTFRSFSLR